MVEQEATCWKLKHFYWIEAGGNTILESDDMESQAISGGRKEMGRTKCWRKEEEEEKDVRRIRKKTQPFVNKAQLELALFHVFPLDIFQSLGV